MSNVQFNELTYEIIWVGLVLIIFIAITGAIVVSKLDRLIKGLKLD